MQKSSETVVFAGKGYLKINLLVKTLLHEFMAVAYVQNVYAVAKGGTVFPALQIMEAALRRYFLLGFPPGSSRNPEHMVAHFSSLFSKG